MLLLLLSYLLISSLFVVEYRNQAKLITTTLQKSGDDRGTTRFLYLVWALILIGTPLYTLFVPASVPSWLIYVGLTLMMCGVGLLMWATHCNMFYLLTLATTDDQYICTEGPYRVVRHPGYAAFILAWCGFSLVAGDIMSFVVTIALVMYAYVLRIRAEEQMMLDFFGVDYVQYIEETYRYVLLCCVICVCLVQLHRA